MSTTVFPLDGSANKAALFALLLGQDNTTDFVGDGLEVSVDTAQSVISVSGGHCYIQVDTGTITGTDKQVSDLGYAVQLPPTTVEPDMDGTLAVVVEPNYDAPNSVSVAAYPDTDSAPTDALVIATVNMGTGEVIAYNRDPDITAADLNVVGHATIDGGLTVTDTVTVEEDIVTASNETIVDSSGTVQADLPQLDASVTEIRVGTAATLPSGGTEGRILIESDTGRILYDDGATLTEVGLSESQISHDNITDISASDHHQEPTAGTAITDEGSNQFGLDTSNSVSFPSGIDSLPAPTAGGDAARKGYVDSIATGLELKDSVAVSIHDTNIDLSSTTDPNPVDGYTLSDGERILLNQQTDPVENGIYVAQTATDPTTWVRSDDMNEDSEVLQGVFTFVRNGTHANQSYVVTSNDPLIVGVDAISWAQFSAAGKLLAGTGITKDGRSLSISENGVTSTELAGDIGGADHATEYFDESDTGVVTDGDFGILMTTTVDAGETFRITRAGFHTITDSSPVGPSPAGADFKIINGAGDTTLATILSGDGTTAYTHETGAPQTTYQNTTDAPQSIVVGVDNGQVDGALGGSDIEIQSAIIGRIE